MRRLWDVKNNGRGRAVLLGMTILLLIFGMVGCGGNGGEGMNAANAENAASESGEDEGDTVFAVSTVRAAEGEIRDYLELNGDVTASRKVDTYPDAAGKLSRLYVEVGQTVKKDQVIAEVDPSRPGMQYTSSPVKAAISGTVTSLPVQVGSTVSQQVPVAQISDMNELEIQVDVAEKFISRMKVGLPVEIGFDAYPGRIFKGRVKELSPVLDPVARTLEVKIAIDNGGNLLKAGMFAEVRIITEEKENILKIPAECMVERFGESFVFIVERNSGDDVGTAYKRSITSGIEVDNKLEVMEGISAGMEVVYRGQTLLDDGSKVRVVEEIQPLSGDDVLE